MNKIVYCSGPMFSPEEKFSMANIATILESTGNQTYLPQRDGIEVAKIMKLVNNPLVGEGLFNKIIQVVRKAIFALDMYQVIERCDSLVINMNGRIVDDGAIVEVSTAYTAGKPIVVYKEDPRSELNGYDNPMLSGLSYTWAYIDSIPKIPDALKKISNEIEKSGVNPYINSKPPRVQALVDAGKEIWDILQIIRIFETKEEELLDIIKKFIEALEGSEKFKSLI